MSYASPALYMQRRVTGGSAGGGECDPYTRPASASVATDLDITPIVQSATAVTTNLCAEVS